MSERLRVPFAELRARAGDGFDAALDEFYEADETLEYERYLPSSRAPSGVLIYLSPKAGAGLPEGWDLELERRNVAWVGGLNVGNDVHVARRVGHALLAPYLLEDVPSSPRYLLGFSGGGRVASMMLPAYPDRFAGAVFVCGANPLMTATRETLGLLAARPMVFLTGSHDFNLEDTRMAIGTFQQAGLSHVELMVIQGLEHALPDAADFGRALESIVHTEGNE